MVRLIEVIGSAKAEFVALYRKMVKINEKTLLYEMKEDSIPFKERVFMRENGMRPQFINLYKCKNILLEGFTINRSPFGSFIRCCPRISLSEK